MPQSEEILNWNKSYKQCGTPRPLQGVGPPQGSTSEPGARRACVKARGSQYPFFLQVNRQNKMNKLLQLPLCPQQTRSVHLHLCLAALLRLQAKLPRATVQASAAGISQNLINHMTLLCWWKLKRYRGLGLHNEQDQFSISGSKILTGWHCVKRAGNFTAQCRCCTSKGLGIGACFHQSWVSKLDKCYTDM